MALFILDTNILTLFSHNHAAVVARVLARPHEEVAITTITVQEAVSGWTNAIKNSKSPADAARASRSLAETIPVLARWRIVPQTEASIARFQALKRMKLNVGASDLHIAAIVLENNATLVTRNVTDFCRIPGLTYENWAD